MTADPGFQVRVRRLAITSSVALGVICVAALASLDAEPMAGVTLAAGWLTMPTVLALSLRHPRVRRLVILPASLITSGLVAICLTALPERNPQQAGWLMLTAGIVVGDGLGAWFWYRWVPVPGALEDPYSRGRWLFIGVHVGLILVGTVLVVLGEAF